MHIGGLTRLMVMMDTRNRFALQSSEDREAQQTHKVCIEYERRHFHCVVLMFTGSTKITNARETAKSSSDDSTSSQDSLLARPPIDWQKQLAFASATETRDSAINLTPKNPTHKGKTSDFRAVTVNTTL
jgi:hypothetical protein